MNALTKELLTTKATVVPQILTCGCCKDVMSLDDHMGDDFGDDHTRAVRAAFGLNVCHACADDFEPAEAGEYRNPDEAYDLLAEEA